MTAQSRFTDWLKCTLRFESLTLNSAGTLILTSAGTFIRPCAARPQFTAIPTFVIYSNKLTTGTLIATHNMAQPMKSRTPPSVLPAGSTVTNTPTSAPEHALQDVKPVRTLQAILPAVNTPAAAPTRAPPKKLDRAPFRTEPHYSFPPTEPSPFKGTLDASLEALLKFGIRYPNSMSILDSLRQYHSDTDWKDMLVKVLGSGDKTKMGNGYLLLVELLFLMTRTLFPEQIAQNRACMRRMYIANTRLSVGMTLRYDMKFIVKAPDQSNRTLYTVQSCRPEHTVGASVSAEYDQLHAGRRPLLPNIWATLIAEPVELYETDLLRASMKHHISKMDKWLLFEDEEVAGWSSERLIWNLVQVLVQWQWLIKDTERMEKMEVGGWEELAVPMDQCEWVRDDRTIKARLRASARD